MRGWLEARQGISGPRFVNEAYAIKVWVLMMTIFHTWDFTHVPQRVTYKKVGYVRKIMVVLTHIQKFGNSLGGGGGGEEIKGSGKRCLFRK